MPTVDAVNKQDCTKELSGQSKDQYQQANNAYLAIIEDVKETIPRFKTRV